MRSEERATFRAPPERVWAVLADWERYAQWMPDVAWVRRLGRKRQEGLVLLVRTKIYGFPVSSDVMRITAWEPPRRLAIEHLGVVHGVAEWRLEPEGPEGDNTRFIWWEDVRIPLPVPLVGELALRCYWPWQRLMFRRSIANLRRLVEER